MTKLSFRVLCAILAASALGGGYLVAPTPAEVGHDEVACDDWFADPQPGPVTLQGCVVELSDVRARSGAGSRDEVIFAIRPAGWVPPESTEHVSPHLFMISDAQEYRSLASHLATLRGDQPELARFVERHRAELVRTADLTGTIEMHTPDSADFDDELADEVPVIRDTSEDPQLGRALGIVLSLFGLLGLLILVPLQRKWTRRREHLTGKGRPLAF